MDDNNCRQLQILLSNEIEIFLLKVGKLFNFIDDLKFINFIVTTFKNGR